MAFVGTRRALLGGSSLPRWAAGFDLWYNYQVPQGSYPLSFPPATDTHSSTTNALTPAATYQSFAANVPVRTGLGLQTVPTRTNSLQQSQTFNSATWTKLNGAIAADSTVAPDNTTTADTFTPDTTNGAHRVNQTFTSSVNTWAPSIFAKPNGYTKVYIRESGVTGAYAVFDMTGAGSVLDQGSGGSGAAITAVANGFYRISMNYTGTAASHVMTYGIPPTTYTTGAPTANWVPDGTSGVFFWQAQAEVGAFPSPPILTTNATATVNGNQQVIDLTGKLGVGVSGFVQTKMVQTGAPTSQAVYFIDVSDGTSSNIIPLFWQVTTGIITLGGVAGGVAGTNITESSAYSGGTTETIAFSIGPTYKNFRRVGQIANTAVTVDPYPVVNQAAVGGRGFDTARNGFQFTNKLALKFGDQNASTFAAAFAAAQLAAVSP